jgi:hypothetical protein
MVSNPRQIFFRKVSFIAAELLVLKSFVHHPTFSYAFAYCFFFFQILRLVYTFKIQKRWLHGKIKSVMDSVPVVFGPF